MCVRRVCSTINSVVLWIRIPDPAFYLNADPDPGQTLKAQKVDFLHEKYT